MIGIVDNKLIEFIGFAIGGVAGLLLAKLMFYEGTVFDFLKCKGALD